MKKTKILMPILGVTATLGAVVPALVSCGGNETNELKINDSKVHRALQTRIVKDEEGKDAWGVIYEGYTFNKKVNMSDIKVDVKTTDPDTSGDLLGFVKKSTLVDDGYDVVVVFENAQSTELGTYRIVLKLSVIDEVVYESDSYHAINRTLVEEPSDIDGVVNGALYQTSYFTPLFDASATITGFVLGGFEEYAFLDNVVVYFYDTNNQPIDELNYNTIFTLTDETTGACSLEFRCDWTYVGWTKDYHIGVYYEDYFSGQEIEMLNPANSKTYRITGTAP